MMKSGNFLANDPGVGRDVDSGNSLLKSISDRKLGICSQIDTNVAKQTSPTVFLEKQSRKKKNYWTGKGNSPASEKVEEVRIDLESVGGEDEKSDLLGGVVIVGKLEWDKRRKENYDNNKPEITTNNDVNAKLTRIALTWGFSRLQLDDVISVTYNVGMRHFTLHAYPFENSSCLRCFKKLKRVRKDYRFLAPSVDSAIQWVGAFADQRCYIYCLPHPLASLKKQPSSELLVTDPPPELLFRCKNPPKMLVILNPRSGRGRSVKVFHQFAEPIFKLAGFKLEVVQTTSAGHAKRLASSVDITTCSDGIICVGGDGIINEVLNGILSRDNQKEGISIPIGIIPAGSDNSLVWTVLGIRDPISAALSIVKGGLTATDVFAIEWMHSGVRHFGMTASYFGFVSDVLEQCDKYQKTFGPLRYLVAGFVKFMCLPTYNYEIEFVRYQTEDTETKQPRQNEVIDMSEIHTDYMRDSNKESLPRASSLSSIDTVRSPNHTPADFDHAPSEPSEYVRALDPRSKRLSFGRNTANSEPEVIHPPVHLSGSKNWPRTRSKSRTDKGWIGLTVTQDVRSSWANDREDISSTLSDPGPIWDAEPKWDSERNRDEENCIQFNCPTDDAEAKLKREMIMKLEDKWEFRKGKFLSIIVCNHACRNVQNSQEVAPEAEHDDYNMDLLLIHGSGRLRLLRFFLSLQIGRHTTLPYVEYIKVKSVKIKPLKHTHNGCGIDGELVFLNGQVLSFLLPEQCRLIGRSRLNNST